MLDETTRATIFKSLPKSFTYDGVARTIAYDYSDAAHIEHLFETSDVIVTMQYARERPDDESVVTNTLMGKSIDGTTDELVYTRGYNEVCDIIFYAHARKFVNGVKGADLIARVLHMIIGWSVVELSRYCNIKSRTELSKVVHDKDSSVKRYFSVSISYPVTWEERPGDMTAVKGTVNDQPFIVSFVD